MGQYYETHEVPFFLRYTPKDRSLSINRLAYDRPSSEITADIEDHFATLHGIDASKVRVICEQNRVTLTGECSDSRIKTYLQNIAGNVLGVRAVQNDIMVKSR